MLNADMQLVCDLKFKVSQNIPGLCLVQTRTVLCKFEHIPGRARANIEDG